MTFKPAAAGLIKSLNRFFKKSEQKLHFLEKSEQKLHFLEKSEQKSY